MTAPTWRCVYCGHPLEEGKHCPMPKCVEAFRAACRRMGVPIAPEPEDEQ